MRKVCADSLHVGYGTESRISRGIFSITSLRCSGLRFTSSIGNTKFFILQIIFGLVYFFLNFFFIDD